VITTEKDAIKLNAAQFTLPVSVLRIELKLDDEEGFMRLVERRLNGSAKLR
jgi:tetraacyldisaccharide-1-P 4'-kinase